MNTGSYWYNPKTKKTIASEGMEEHYDMLYAEKFNELGLSDSLKTRILQRSKDAVENAMKMGGLFRIYNSHLETAVEFYAEKFKETDVLFDILESFKVMPLRYDPHKLILENRRTVYSVFIDTYDLRNKLKSGEEILFESVKSKKNGLREMYVYGFGASYWYYPKENAWIEGYDEADHEEMLNDEEYVDGLKLPDRFKTVILATRPQYKISKALKFGLIRVHLNDRNDFYAEIDPQNTNDTLFSIISFLKQLKQEGVRIRAVAIQNMKNLKFNDWPSPEDFERSVKSGNSHLAEHVKSFKTFVTEMKAHLIGMSGYAAMFNGFWLNPSNGEVAAVQRPQTHNTAIIDPAILNDLKVRGLIKQQLEKLSEDNDHLKENEAIAVRLGLIAISKFGDQIGVRYNSQKFRKNEIEEKVRDVIEAVYDTEEEPFDSIEFEDPNNFSSWNVSY